MADVRWENDVDETVSCGGVLCGVGWYIMACPVMFCVMWCVTRSVLWCFMSY